MTTTPALSIDIDKVAERCNAVRRASFGERSRGTLDEDVEVLTGWFIAVYARLSPENLIRAAPYQSDVRPCRRRANPWTDKAQFQRAQIWARAAWNVGHLYHQQYRTVAELARRAQTAGRAA
ncbi:hypothetical protein ABT160_43125 [Streptomyces sp. NPDC001941]|uniref:hypothetical protein n=1 Tax=Streptomyces sp. NPDC001941 TaxID=3154659 RepID=UPI00331E901D